MSNVVSLKGDAIPENGVDAGCVELLRGWLAKAEAGSIHSVAIVGVSPQETVLSDWWRSPGHGHALVAGIEYLKVDMHAQREPSLVDGAD